MLPVLAVVAVYARTTGHELVWDDPLLLGSLRDRPPGTGLLDVVLAPLTFSPSYFRPFGTASLLLEMELAGGMSSALHHGVNVALHALSTLLVGLLAMRATRGATWIAVAAAALYGLHPALVEGVAFVSSRFDLLVTLCLLAALMADGGVSRSVTRAITVGALFLCAALSKEMAAAFVVVLPVWHLALADGRVPVMSVLREHRVTYISVLAAGFAYLGIRAMALPSLLPQPEASQIVAGSLLQHALLVASSLGMYASLLVAPFGRIAPIHFSELPVPTGDLFAWVSVALLAATVLVVAVRRSRPGGAALLACAALVALLPVANIRPLALGGGAIVAERFLLFPAALATLAAAAGVAASRRRTLLLAVGTLWLAAAAAQVVGVVGNWESRETLWAWAMAKAPRSAMPPVNLSLVESQAGRSDSGAALARRAIELDPSFPDAYANLGLALALSGKHEEAHDAFVLALDRAPETPLLWSNLGRTLLEMGRAADAERVLLDRALPLDPHLAVTHTNLAEVYMRSDRPDLAAKHLETALSLMPAEESGWVREQLAATDDWGRWLAMGDRLAAAGEQELALEALDGAARRGAPDELLALGRANALVGLERFPDAQRVLEAALESHPDDPRLHNNLGALARTRGDRGAARAHFARAVELAPDWELARDNLASVSD